MTDDPECAGCGAAAGEPCDEAVDHGDMIEVFDEHGLGLCSVCIDGILEKVVPWQADAVDHPSSRAEVLEAAEPGRGFSRTWSWEASGPVDQEVAKDLRLYLAEPKCEPRWHRWYEEKELRDLKEEIGDAASKLAMLKVELANVEDREPGWSIREWHEARLKAGFGEESDG